MTTWHYILIMGLDDTPGARAVWIADSANWRNHWFLVPLRRTRQYLLDPAEGLLLRRRSCIGNTDAADSTAESAPKSAGVDGG